MSVDMDLEFQPEFNALCYLLDAPAFLGVFVVGFLCSVVFHILDNLMMGVAFAALIMLLMRFLSGSKNIGATLGVVYPDRVEVEVGMNNPTLTLIEFSNFKKVEATQSAIQKMFGTYSIKFTYTSDFTGKDIYYELRDFKNPKPIVDKIKKAYDASHLRRINDKTKSENY